MILSRQGYEQGCLKSDACKSYFLGAFPIRHQTIVHGHLGNHVNHSGSLCPPPFFALPPPPPRGCCCCCCCHHLWSWVVAGLLWCLLLLVLSLFLRRSLDCHHQHYLHHSTASAVTPTAINHMSGYPLLLVLRYDSFLV